jgi:hypothetical protein
MTVFSGLCRLARRMQRRRALAIGIVWAHEIDRGQRGSCNERRTASQAKRSRFHGFNGHRTPARSYPLIIIIILRENARSLLLARDFGRRFTPASLAASATGRKKRSLATGPANLTSVQKRSLVRIDHITNLLSGKIWRCCMGNPVFRTAGDGWVWFQECLFRCDHQSVFYRSGLHAHWASEF